MYLGMFIVVSFKYIHMCIHHHLMIMQEYKGTTMFAGIISTRILHQSPNVPEWTQFQIFQKKSKQTAYILPNIFMLLEKRSK